MLDIDRLKKTYASDLSQDVDLIDEALASIESISEYMTEDEIYHRQRPLMLAYLAIYEIKEART